MPAVPSPWYLFSVAAGVSPVLIHIFREFKPAFYDEIGKGKLQSFNSFKKARRAANNVNVSLMKGEVKALVLSNDDKVVQLAEEAGIKWKHNALRHSFASYRLAQIQNANQVALETGHTVKVLFTNYRELVAPEDGHRTQATGRRRVNGSQVVKTWTSSVLFRHS
jgi:hypothetical protein